MDKYMPIKKRIDMGPLENNNCAVCLVDFEDEDIVRQTICNHHFH